MLGDPGGTRRGSEPPVSIQSHLRVTGILPGGLRVTAASPSAGPLPQCAHHYFFQNHKEQSAMQESPARRLPLLLISPDPLLKAGGDPCDQEPFFPPPQGPPAVPFLGTSSRPWTLFGVFFLSSLTPVGPPDPGPCKLLLC